MFVKRTRQEAKASGVPPGNRQGDRELETPRDASRASGAGTVNWPGQGSRIRTPFPLSAAHPAPLS